MVDLLCRRWELVLVHNGSKRVSRKSTHPPPLGPTSATVAPLGIVKEMLRRAGMRLSYAKETLSTESRITNQYIVNPSE